MSAAASDAARLMAVVVLPTPPFWFAIAMVLPMTAAPSQCSTWNEIGICSTWN